MIKKYIKAIISFMAALIFSLMFFNAVQAQGATGPTMKSSYFNHHTQLFAAVVLVFFLFAMIYLYRLRIAALRAQYDKIVDSLKEQQEIFNQFLELSPIYVFFKDEKIRVLNLSKNYEKMLGMPVSNALGKTMDDLFPSDLAKKMIQDDLKILNEEIPVELVEKLGDRTYVTLKFPIKRDGKPKLLAGFTIDITEQKRVESALIEAKRQAETANEAKSMFLANMSHELRTPMNGIIGFANLMEMSGLDEKQKEYNEMIKASANHLFDLINDILDFSKLEAKKLRLENKPFDIIQTVRSSIGLIEQHVEKKNINLDLELKSDINYKIKGDQLRIKQIIINLLSNAVKFTSKGSIKLCVEEKERKDLKAVIAISVSDTGAGIPRDKIDKIFEMFIQLDNSDSRAQSGAGLGLSIVKGLVETMGGKVSVDSEEGRGSVFTVEIPFDIYFVSGGENNVNNNVSGVDKCVENFKRPLNILIAEDDVINQRLMNAIMTKLKWETSIAGNGKEAVDLYKRNKYDAIIMDGQMPEMNGFDAARAIREIEKTSASRVPIIALTAYAMKGDREKFISAGMDDYISKPITSEKILINILRKYVSD